MSKARFHERSRPLAPSPAATSCSWTASTAFVLDSSGSSAPESHSLVRRAQTRRSESLEHPLHRRRADQLGLLRRRRGKEHPDAGGVGDHECVERLDLDVEVERVLRPGGRLLVLHDYGRDDVAHLRGERPEYGLWSKRGGPFLKDGFKVRVVHCFWTFDSIEAGGEFLAAAFAEPGRLLASALKRPRLSYNVAIYHRSFGDPTSPEPGSTSR